MDLERARLPKWLVVGASGQVGAQMALQISRRHGADAVLRTSRRPNGGGELTLDLAELSTTEQAAALLDAHELGYVLCVGGMTYVDGCESEPDLAFRTNARGPGVLADYAHRRQLPFVYFSTDYIFGGLLDNPGPYPEDAPPGPLNVYGRSKLAGEHDTLSAHPDALILRTTVVYGPDQQGKNFLYTLVDKLSRGVTMQVPSDQISTPTYNEDLARAAVGLVEAGASGIFHVCGPERMDRLAFAAAAAKHMGMDVSLLQGVETGHLKQPASRPLHAGLSTRKLRDQFPSLHMRSPSEGIAAFHATLGVHPA